MNARVWWLACWLIIVGLSSACREREKDASGGVGGTDAGAAAPGFSSARPALESVPAEVEAPAGLIEVSGNELLTKVQRSGHQAVIVNAWASWCGPCRREMPMLLALRTNLEPRGVGVELVSVDEPASREQAIAFLKQHGAPLPSYLAERPLGPFKVALNPRWPGMLPASFLFDSAGELRYFWGGPVYEHELLEVVDAFLAGTLVETEARFGLAPGKVQHD